jgi:hypothetical protein
VRHHGAGAESVARTELAPLLESFTGERGRTTCAGAESAARTLELLGAARALGPAAELIAALWASLAARTLELLGAAWALGAAAELIGASWALLAARTLELLGATWALGTAAELIATAALLMHAILHVLADALACELALSGRHLAESVPHLLAHLGRNSAAAVFTALIAVSSARSGSLITLRSAVIALLLHQAVADPRLGFRTLLGRKIAEMVRDAFTHLGRELLEVEVALATATVVPGLAITLRLAVIAARRCNFARAGATVVPRGRACFSPVIASRRIFGLGKAVGGGKADCGGRGDHEAGNTNHWKAPVRCSQAERARRVAIARKCRDRGSLADGGGEESAYDAPCDDLVGVCRSGLCAVHGGVQGPVWEVGGGGAVPAAEPVWMGGLRARCVPDRVLGVGRVRRAHGGAAVGVGGGVRLGDGVRAAHLGGVDAGSALAHRAG